MEYVVVGGLILLIAWFTMRSGRKPQRKDVVRNKPAPPRVVSGRTFSVDVVGESHYQGNLEVICGGRTEDGADKNVEATLILEDENPFDPNAVRVDIEGKTVGYLSRETARNYRRWLERKGLVHDEIRCTAVIKGGWDRGKGDRGHFGVTLALPG